MQQRLRLIWREFFDTINLYSQPFASVGWASGGSTNHRQKILGKINCIYTENGQSFLFLPYYSVGFPLYDTFLSYLEVSMRGLWWVLCKHFPTS
jgi:hypothetical protein